MVLAFTLATLDAMKKQWQAEFHGIINAHLHIMAGYGTEVL